MDRHPAQVDPHFPPYEPASSALPPVPRGHLTSQIEDGAPRSYRFQEGRAGWNFARHSRTRSVCQTRA